MEKEKETNTEHNKAVSKEEDLLPREQGKLTPNADVTQKMSKEEIKRRLAGRAAEYLMFLDD